MAGWRQTDTAELVAMLHERATLRVKLALVADAVGTGEVGDQVGWRLHYGEVSLDEDGPVVERAWRYATAVFLELVLPGETVAALLQGGTGDVLGIRFAVPSPQSPTASRYHLRGQEEWGQVTTRWPRTEWTISRDSGTTHTGEEVLVGDGPSFVSFDQALSAFVFARPYSSATRQSDLWRITLPQRAGWLSRIAIAADLMTVDVVGDALDSAALELSTATGNQVQAADAPGVYRFPLPQGLQPESLLILRDKEQWLDLRTFPAPAYGRARDASVVWEEPGTELEILLAGGEGQHLELKAEVPEGESRKKLLKTIAAFASQDGGTVLIGVQDDLQISGLPDAENIDKLTLTVVNMIRDTIEPVPRYTTRVIEHDGRRVLAVEVSGGGQMYAYRDKQRLEFYVRVGPNTVPARHHEVAAGFRQS